MICCDSRLQPVGRIRRCERRGAPITRPELPLDRLGVNLGARSCVAVAVTLVQGRGVNLGGEPGRSEPDQSGTAGEGGEAGAEPAGLQSGQLVAATGAAKTH
jgi:hypothetical protein